MQLFCPLSKSTPKNTEHVSVSFARSGGPGGQNVNKVNNKVDMRFNVKDATWLSERIQDKILLSEKNRINKDGEIVISSTKTRTQQGNIQDCLSKLQPVASTINTLAGALYKVFLASPDQAMKEMRQACFEYLSLGGIFSNRPISLLSGLNPRPLSLVLHFFAVAVYGVGCLLLPFPSPKRIWIGARLISGAAGIIFPIIKAEGVRKMFFPAMVPAYYRAPPVKS